MMYKYMCIDATYYLRRNWYVIKDKPDFDKGKLIGLFLMSVLKFYKQFPSEKIILLFDKSPYRKMEVIKEYKTNRYRVEDERETLEKKLAEAKTDEERESIKKLLDPIIRESELFKVIGQSKYEILVNFDKFGLVSINKQGFEADDLAYYISLLSKELKERTLLVSGDCDWACFANEYTDVFRGKSKDPHLYTYEEVMNMYKPYTDLVTPYQFYQINDIYSGGHNNVVLDFDKSKYELNDIVKKIVNHDIDDIKEFNDYYEALNMDKYFDEIKRDIYVTMKYKGRVDFSKWDEYYDLNKPNIRKSYFSSVLFGRLNKEIYSDGE